MYSVTSNKLNLKYKRFTQPGCNDIGIRQFEFVAKTQILNKTSAIIEAFL